MKGLVITREMIYRLLKRNLDSILEVINEAAQVYKGVIPDDRWKEPYMSAKELEEQIDSGVDFFGWQEEGRIIGVMGIQELKEVTLIRHAYVLTEHQRRGVGSKLLQYSIDSAKGSEILVGTWKAAGWAIQFYEAYGFTLVSSYEKDRLLREYWNIPERQIETSLVLTFNKG